MIGQSKLSGKSSYIRIPHSSNKTDIKNVLKILTDRYSDKFEFIDMRKDFYAYMNVGKVVFKESYIIKDIINERYIYFLKFEGTGFNGFETILITTSTGYDKSENICWQDGITKAYLAYKKKANGEDAGFDVVGETKDPHYVREVYPQICFISIEYGGDYDVYIVNSGQSFAIFTDENGTLVEPLSTYIYKFRKKDAKCSYVVYDTSDKYHTDNKLVSCIYSSGYMYRLMSVNIGLDNIVGFPQSCYTIGSKFACMMYVPADTYDNGKSGYYFEISDELEKYINDYAYFPTHEFINGRYVVEPISTNREYLFDAPRVTELYRPDNENYVKQYSFDDYFFGFCMSSMDIYILYNIIPKYNQTAFNENNNIGTYLDINYYSGLRSTLNNGSLALPNIAYIMRQPSVLNNMSAVMESEFMYIIDMEDKSNGDIVECIDNEGNKIKLICFMAYQSVTDLFCDKVFPYVEEWFSFKNWDSVSYANNPKQLGIGIRLE